MGRPLGCPWCDRWLPPPEPDQVGLCLGCTMPVVADGPGWRRPTPSELDWIVVHPTYRQWFGVR